MINGAKGCSTNACVPQGAFYYIIVKELHSLQESLANAKVNARQLRLMVLGSPKGTSLCEIVSFDVLCVKIGSAVLAV